MFVVVRTARARASPVVHAGVVVLSMSGVGLGFGVTARSTTDTRNMDPTNIIVFHQADVGEYLRDEETLF